MADIRELTFDVEKGFSKEKIETYENDNNTILYLINITKNEFRKTYDLTGKKVKLCLLNPKEKKGNIIDITIRDYKSGVVEFPINSKITLNDGDYICQFNITGTAFNQSTKTFTLRVNDNIFNDISGEIVKDKRYEVFETALKDLARIERSLADLIPILDKKIPELDSALEKVSGYLEFVDKLEYHDKEIGALKGTFSSAEDRLINEVNKINDNIKDISFIPFEGEEIEIDKSLNGYTRDFTIKGKTLHNIRVGEEIQNPGYTVWTKVSNNEYKVVGTNAQKGMGGLILLAKTLFKASTRYSLIFEYTATGVVSGELRPDTHVSYNVATTTTHAIENGNRTVKLNFTTKDDITGKSCKISLSEFVGNMTIKNIMVIENIDFIPPYFEGIKSMGEEDGNKISVLSQSKNLFNINQLKSDNAMTILSNGYRINSRWAYSRGMFNINLKPNTEYYSIADYKVIRPAIGSIDENGGRIALKNPKTNQYLIIIAAKQKEMEFTTPSDIKDYTEILFYSDGGGGSDLGECEVTNIYLAKKKGEYKNREPYKEYKKDISVSFTNGLKSLPDGTSDEIEHINTKNKINEKIKMRVLDGTENWMKSSDSERTNTLNFATSTFDSEIKKGSLLICNKFINKLTWGTDEESCATESAASKLRFRILKSKLDSEDVAGFKKYLRDLYESGDPVIIYYELAKPIIHDLDESINLEVYKDKTYIRSNNSIQPMMSCKAPVDVQNTISGLLNENEALKQNEIKLKDGEILMANCLIDIIGPIEESEHRMEKGIKNLSKLRNLVDSLLNMR